ncbi:MAG: helix-turn-helix domain-containing protein [Candidatus Altiarchaeota archaeon]
MDELLRLGLTEYEKNTYIALIQAGPLTGQKVSSVSGVPQGKVYQALKGLEGKGMVKVNPVRPKVFSAVEPEDALKKVVEERRNELQRIQDLLIPQLTNLKKAEASEPTSERIKIITGIGRQWDFVEYLWNTTKDSIKYMFTYEERPERITRATYKCAGRGADVRIIGTKKTEDGIKMMKEDVRHGVQVRYFPVDELRLAIKDHKEARLHLVNPKNDQDRISAHVQSVELANALEHYFDALWEKAEVIQ